MIPASYFKTLQKENQMQMTSRYFQSLEILNQLDEVHFKTRDGYYFWDEGWSAWGPYESELDCRLARVEYEFIYLEIISNDEVISHIDKIK